MEGEVIVHSDNAGDAIDSVEALRARHRIHQLRASFAFTLNILADMYLDEDWKHLTGPDGNPYETFTAMLVDELGVSPSYARRHQQGVIDVVVPLREAAGPSTRVPVTSADIVALGKKGAERVRAAAPHALEGVSDPGDQEQALRNLLDSERAEAKAAAPPAPDESGADDDYPASLVPSSRDEVSDPSAEIEPPPPEDIDLPWGAQDDEPSAGEGGTDRPRGVDTAMFDATPDSDDGDQQRPLTAVARPAPPPAHTTRASSSPGSYGDAVSFLANNDPGELSGIDLDTVTAATVKLTRLRAKLVAAQNNQGGRP